MITKEIAVALRVGDILYHKTMKNRDGTALRARVNGKCKTWKRDGSRWELPMKHGLRDCFYISQYGADQPHEWTFTEPLSEKERKALCASVGLSATVPLPILRDALTDAGKEREARRLTALINEE